MADAFRLAPWLLIALAVGPAAAQPVAPGLKLKLVDPGRIHDPEAARREALGRMRLVQEDTDPLPTWTLPFGAGPGDRDRHGWSFGVRPGRGLKATARLRF